MLVKVQKNSISGTTFALIHDIHKTFLADLLMKIVVTSRNHEM